MKKLLALLGLFILILFSASLAFHKTAFAEDVTVTPAQHIRQEIRQDVKEIRQNVREDMKNKLPTGGATPSGARRRICELHLRGVKEKEIVFGKHGITMLTRFNAISAGVQKYYTEKLVPAGKTVSNYDTLVSDVNSKKTALQPLIDKVKGDSSTLTCDADKASDQFKTFRTDAGALLQGLKDYRQSVINLVKAVRAIAPNDTLSPVPTEEISPSPTPEI